MKYFIYIMGILISTVCTNCDMPAELKKVFENCRTEWGFPEEPPKVPPNVDDPKVKCYYACIMKKIGLLKDRKMVAEKVLHDLLQDQPNKDDSFKAVITACINKANEQSDDCEVAATLHKCLHEKVKDPKH